uniref:Uncharacterized protein n=1 Tax=Cacopsylla melanoneura TaxID=428564 RepID=A0A8D8U133_9HEMI
MDVWRWRRLMDECRCCKLETVSASYPPWRSCITRVSCARAVMTVSSCVSHRLTTIGFNIRARRTRDDTRTRRDVSSWSPRHEATATLLVAGEELSSSEALPTVSCYNSSKKTL